MYDWLRVSSACDLCHCESNPLSSAVDPADICGLTGFGSLVGVGFLASMYAIVTPELMAQTKRTLLCHLICKQIYQFCTYIFLYILMDDYQYIYTTYHRLDMLYVEMYPSKGHLSNPMVPLPQQEHSWNDNILTGYFVGFWNEFLQFPTTLNTIEPRYGWNLFESSCSTFFFTAGTTNGCFFFNKWAQMKCIEYGCAFSPSYLY